jgi:hypothetical protein
MSIRRIAPFAAILLVGSLVSGQQPAKKDTTPKEPAKTKPKEPSKPVPGSLEDTLEKALRNSADIKAAEAKVREAEAELNKVRHQVLTKATALYSDLTLAKRLLAVAEQSLARLTGLYKSGTVSGEVMMTAESEVTKHRGEVEKLETELKSLRGEFAIKGVTGLTFSPDGTWLYATDVPVRIWDPNTGVQWPSGHRRNPINLDAFDVAYSTIQPVGVQATMAERVRKLLDQVVEYQLDSSPALWVDALLKEAAKSDIPIRDLLPRPLPDGVVVNLGGKLPVGAWFQAIEDTDPNLRIVIRDYGLLLTTKDRIPDGAIRAVDFWKSKDPKSKEEAKPGEKK